MGTDEIDKLKPWLSNIHARAPGCPVIVVGTHYDLLSEGKQQDTPVISVVWNLYIYMCVFIISIC